MTLYHCRDTRSLRALWALEEAGLAYEIVKMPFPLGTVPALVFGDMVMTESAAICQYIAEISQPRLGLKLSDPGYPAYLNWLHRSDATLTFRLALVLRYSRLELPVRRVPQVVDDYRRWFLKRVAVAEDALEESDFLCGRGFAVADIAVGYALYLADRIGIAPELGARTKHYLLRLTSRAAFRRAMMIQADMEEVV